MQIGSVREIWRFPVKGMGGERVSACTLGAAGVAGDRIWAVRDAARAEIQSCKFRPELLLCTARLRSDEAVEIRLPGGETYDSNDAGIHEVLSALVGHASSLVPLRAADDHAFFRRYHGGAQDWLIELKATFEREAEEPLPDFDSLPDSVAEYVTTPGTFFLVAPLHVVTTATLEHLETLNPSGNWDARRFRPNLVIETSAEVVGLPEQRWIGKRLRLGDAVVTCSAPTPRCGAVTRRQYDLPNDRSVLRTVVRQAEQNVGVYGAAVISGQIKEGDPVFLE